MTSYLEAGVDLEAADRHVDSIAGAVTATWGSGVTGGFGGFAAGVRLPAGMTDPVLMMTTDGVGTKLDLARRTGRWEGVGLDLVAMCVDDLATVGARPIGFVDYLAVGSLRAERDREIVASIADACSAAGCPLLGGETAEHPGVMEQDAVDLAGAALGVVEADSVLGPERVGAGDAIVGLVSPNPRSNGFSLIRSVLGEDVLSHAEALLAPSVIYSPAVMATVAVGGVHAAAHVTGGGIALNLARALPDGLGAVLDTSTWDRPAIFDAIAARGVPDAEMRRTFNLGIGFCLVVADDAVGSVLQSAAEHSPRVIGHVGPGSGVTLA